MKKIILAVAATIASLGSAYAQGSPVTHNGSLALTVNDYLTMVPNGSFAAGPVVYNNPTDMMATTTFGPGTITIVASRAWKYEYSASDFSRTGPGAAPSGVATSVPVGNIWKVTTNTGSAGVNTLAGIYQSATTGLANMANQGSGTLSSTFTLAGQLTPGLTNQMSGNYSSTIQQIASLQ